VAKAIIKKVAAIYELPVDTIQGSSLRGQNAEANRLATYIIRETTNLSWTEIGILLDEDASNRIEVKGNNAFTKYQKFKTKLNPEIKEKIALVMAELDLKETKPNPRYCYPHG
jgi:hypothetical protein